MTGMRIGSVLALCWILIGGPGPAAAEPGEPLLDLAASVQELDLDHFQLQLQLRGVMPNETDLGTSLTCDQGVFYSPAHATTPKYNQARHEVDTTALRVTDGRLQGPLLITVKPDAWVPADGEAWTLRVALDAAIDRTSEPWTLAGDWQAEVAGTERTGTAAGTLALAKRTDHWNRGRWSGEGVAFAFDLGERRVNWNHARQAVCTFRPARDLSQHGGLVVSVATDQPRDDAQVAIWLQEEDGSWYYVKNAVPLIDEHNRAAIPFDAFAIAEWVAPGNHMDEDYRLDLSAVGGIAIGVVNPLGVGEVSFTLTTLELLPAAEPEPTASIAVTGELLSVNGHEVVPAGLFGGYAPDLAQRYRPGCQRYLYPSSYPHVPLQRWASFGREDFADWQAVLRLVRGDVEEHRAFADHLLGVLGDGKVAQQLEQFDPAKHLERIDQKYEDPSRREREQARAPDPLLSALNRLLRSRSLYDATVWPGTELPDAVRDGLAGMETMNDTGLMELNRRLLSATLPGAVDPGEPYTEIFDIDCFGERKQPAAFLSMNDWRTGLTNWARTFAENAHAAGCDGESSIEVVFELWNEPYLHWGAKDRVNLQTKYYRTDLAEEGGPVMVKRHDAEGGLIDGEIVPHFKWVRGSDPKGRKQAHEGLYVIDETAFTYWSGRGNGWIYDQMMAVMGRTMQETNPHVEVLAGWGFRWQEDHWAAWDLLYKHTIDRNIAWIDGLHEHHYQGETTAMQASYEVAVAYGVTAHDKWLHCFNTETNDLVDSPSRGAVDTPEKAAASVNYRRCLYNLRELVYAIQESPDKARGRTVIHWPHTEQGSDVCYGLLRNLRGRLVRVLRDEGDPGIWCVASVDGSDPQALPPGQEEPAARELVVVAFNDHPTPRKVVLSVAPPSGTAWRGSQTVECTRFDPATFAIAREEHHAGLDAEPTATLRYELELAPHQAWKVGLPLTGTLPEEPDLRRDQYFAADILATIRREQPFATRIVLPADVLIAKRARLRLVVEDLGVGEGLVTVAGQQLTLPAVFTADNVCRILELPLDPTGLVPDTELVFTTAAGNHAGYRVDMASIVLER